jgi:hypothetical protein
MNDDVVVEKGEEVKLEVGGLAGKDTEAGVLASVDADVDSAGQELVVEAAF